MPSARLPKIWISPDFQILFNRIQFHPEMIFDAAVKPWRTLPDRENCVWDIPQSKGDPIRMHVKRYNARRAKSSPAELEAAAYQLLDQEKIPSARLAAWGHLADGRSFVVIPNLIGFEAADKLIQSAADFDKLILPTADLAAQLHNAGLHHRDLYLCHFFVRPNAQHMDVRLIDAARLARLPGLTRQRWIVKDLAQFWFSTTELPVSDAQRLAWLNRYAQQRNIDGIDRLRRSIERKSNWIASHDARLRKRQPNRNISIPRL